MIITEREARHLAELASLNPGDEELRALSSDLNKIVNYFDEMNQLDTSDVEPTYQVTGLSNVWREDAIEEHLGREALLDLAPAQRDNCIEVPQVL